MTDAGSLNYYILTFEDPMPPEVMPPGYKELMQDDVNGDTVFETAWTAEMGVLQRLGLPKRASC